jgi:ribonuclease HIII
MKPYVTTIDTARADELSAALNERGFSLTEAPHAHFSAKKKGVSVTLYTSGKLVIQGKEMAEFIEFYLEPEFLGSVGFGYEHLEIDQTPRIGVDESGKGDFFGPLATAAVYAGPDQFDALLALGVADSKTLNDKKIRSIAPKIRAQFAHHIVMLGPKTYNEMYQKFKNLNHLLAWCHATAIENVVATTGCKKVVVDQFASEWVVNNQLKRKNLQLDVTQRPRAESDPVVAAASILARYTFVMGIEKLGQEYGLVLPKGASAKVLAVGRSFVTKYGSETLPMVCKRHFTTFQRITGNA